MKRVDFEELEITNFKSFVGKTVSVRLDGDGVCYVRGKNLTNARCGSNGSGKTSIFDALCWCLYGRTPSLLRNPDIEPWYGKKETLVTLGFRIDKKSHTATRSTHPNRLLLDGVEASQERIEELVGISFEVMISAMLLGQGRPLFFDLTPGKKMELFSDALQLDRWDRYSDEAAKCVKDFDADLTGFELYAAELNGSLDEVESLHKEAKTASEVWAAKWRTQQRTKEDERKVLAADLEKQENLLASAILREEGASTELKAQQGALDKLEDDYQVLKRQEARLNEELLQSEHRASDLEEALKELSAAKVCPTCGQAVKHADLADHRAELKAELKVLQARLVAGVPDKLTKALEVLTEKAQQASSYLQGFRGRADAAEAEIGRLRPLVVTLQTRLRQEREAAKAAEANPHLAQIKTLETRRAALKAGIKSIEVKVTNASRALERHKFWVKGFKDLKLQQLDLILDELYIVTNGMLSEIGLGDWEVHFALEKETKSGSIQRAINVRIASPESRGLVKWEVWSFGEGQRLRLIGALALADVLLNHAGVQPNLEIFDEPTQHMSGEGIQDVCDMLVERANVTGKSIFYVDHNAVESSQFQSVLTVVRDKDGSYIKS
jgi:DNA repair exonuclease SbcCD ATPase subunit